MRSTKPRSLWAAGVAIGLTSIATTPAASANPSHYLVYVGTYTGPNSQGVYAFRFDARHGRAEPPFLAAALTNPTFLALGPGRRFLYAVGEASDFRGQKAGAVSALRIDRDSGRLELVNQVSSGGRGPCHLTLDAAGKWVLVANYGGGSVAVLPVQSDGALGDVVSFHQHRGSSVNPRRQEGPHAHGVTLDAANRLAVVPDLGLDRYLLYRLDLATGRLTPHEPPDAQVAPGSGPRHFVFGPESKHAYGINELTSTVTAFRFDRESGTLREIQTVSTLPDDFKGESTTAEIEVHPNGRFVYGSNRGHDSLAVLARDPGTGTLKLLRTVSTQGKVPRHFAIDPSGAWLWAANQGSDRLVLFRLDPESGLPTPTDVTVPVGAPVCVVYLPLD